MLVSRDTAFLHDGQPAADKLTVLILGSQHGNEESGSEVTQILARRLLGGDLAPWLAQMNFVLVASANPDGRDLHKSLNAHDDNPNIDYVALSAPETRLFVDSLHRYQPDVVLDLHETWNDKWPMTPKEGFLTTTDAQFEVGNNPNLDGPLSQYANQVFLPKLIRAVRHNGVEAQRYSEIYSIKDPVRRGGLSLSNFRNYAAMQGSLSLLLENRHDDARGRYETPVNIGERVRKQLLCAQQALALLAEDSDKVRQLSRSARQQPQSQQGQGHYALKYAFAPNKQHPQMQIKLADLQGNPVMKTFKLEDAVQVRQVGDIPDGFVIQAETTRFRELLDHHHIQYQQIQKTEDVWVQQQRVSHLDIAQQTYPGTRDWLAVTLEEKPVRLQLKPGDLLVSTQQPLGKLASILLDPRSSNTIYQEPSWRGLLLMSPLPVAPRVHELAKAPPAESAKKTG